MAFRRARAWIGTSYSLTAIPDSPTLQEIAFQQEVCPSTQRTHLQFFLHFTHAKTLNGVKHFIGDRAAHIEQARSLPHARQYCLKEETRLPNGTHYSRIHDQSTPRPAQKRPTNDEIITLSTPELWRGWTDWMRRNYVGVRAQRSALCPSRIREAPVVYVLCGEPGSGKSTGARKHAQLLGKEIYSKPRGDFWLGYRGEEAILFDDYYNTEAYDNLLRWLDAGNIWVSTKGSQKELRATHFYFTSNLRLAHWHSKIEDKAALYRRITKYYWCEKHIWTDWTMTLRE